LGPNDILGDARFRKLIKGDFDKLREIKGILVGNAGIIVRRQRPSSAPQQMRSKKGGPTQSGGPFVAQIKNTRPGRSNTTAPSG
jgi:hypothetical protein